MVRVGLIAAGFMGKNHFNQYEALAGKAKLVALCDKEPDRRSGDWSKVGGNIADAAGAKRDLSGIKQYADWKELVADPNVEMVDICAPTYLHKEMSITALQAGKHVLCEKPMALNVADCDEMLAVAKAAKGKFMIAQVIRFWPEFAYLKKLIDDRTYGEVKAVHVRRQASTPDYSLNNWILDPKLSGGAILDLHVHDTDYGLFLFGKPKAVTAQGIQRVPGSVDRVEALWHYGRELVVHLEGYWDMPPGFGFNMGITTVFEKAALTFDLGKPLTVFQQGKDPQTPEIPKPADGYYAEIEYMLDCVTQGKTPSISTPAASRDAVAMALAEKESVLTGKTVEIK